MSRRIHSLSTPRTDRKGKIVPQNPFFQRILSRGDQKIYRLIRKDPEPLIAHQKLFPPPECGISHPLGKPAQVRILPAATVAVEHNALPGPQGHVPQPPIKSCCGGVVNTMDLNPYPTQIAFWVVVWMMVGEVLVEDFLPRTNRLALVRSQCCPLFPASHPPTLTSNLPR